MGGRSGRCGPECAQPLRERVLLLFRDGVPRRRFLGQGRHLVGRLALQLVRDFEAGLVCDLGHEEVDLVRGGRDGRVVREGSFEVAGLNVHVFELGLELVHHGRDLALEIPKISDKTLGERKKNGSERPLLTLSRFMSCIARSMFFTTAAIDPVTWRIVTAVSTRLATASILDERRSRLRDSLFFRIAFEA